MITPYREMALSKAPKNRKGYNPIELKHLKDLYGQLRGDEGDWISDIDSSLSYEENKKNILNKYSSKEQRIEEGLEDLNEMFYSLCWGVIDGSRVEEMKEMGFNNKEEFINQMYKEKLISRRSRDDFLGELREQKNNLGEVENNAEDKLSSEGVSDINHRGERSKKVVQNEGWDLVVQRPSVILVQGRRGSGKSSLGYYLVDKYGSKYNVGKYVVGLPEDKWFLLPDNITPLGIDDELPSHSIIFIDEAGMLFYARESQSSFNKKIDKLLSISRHKDQIIILATHNSRKLDVGIVMDCDALVFKEPSKLYAKFDRKEIKEMTQYALNKFSFIDKKKELSVVFSHDFDGKIIHNGLPHFWSEEISEAYSSFTNHKPTDPREEVIRKFHDKDILLKILEWESQDHEYKDLGWEMKEIKEDMNFIKHIKPLLNVGILKRSYTSRKYKNFRLNIPIEEFRELIKIK
jgi:predicted AAA+ superfamily ATPase